MSFIQKDQNTTINARLTSYGRRKLASGELNFNGFSVGDSEIDYSTLDITYDKSNFNVLQPFDDNSDMKNPIKRNSFNENYINNIPNITVNEKIVINEAKERGLFTNSGGTYYFDTSLVKNTGTFTVNNGSNLVDLVSGNVNADELFYVRVENNFTSISNVDEYLPNEYTEVNIYKVMGVTGSTIELDRKFSLTDTNYDSTTFTYYSFPYCDPINSFFGSGDTTPYWDESSLNFSKTCNTPIDVPVWNLNIVHSDDLEGLTGSTFQTIQTFKSRDYLGFKQYIDEQDLRMLGMIHYSNNTISNFYAEGLFEETPTVELPNIMYHKLNTFGVTLKTDTTVKELVLNTGNTLSNVEYRDVYIDGVTGDTGIIGKCFNSMKMIVIEDSEFLSALSYKSNRNFTLPDLTYEFVNSKGRTNIFNNSNQSIYLSFLFGSSLNNNYLHNTNIFRIDASDLVTTCNNSLDTVLNVSFDDINDLFFLNDDYFIDGLGYHGDTFSVIAQITENDELPKDDSWKEINITGVTKVNGGVVLDNDVLVNNTFDITGDDYTNAPIYDLGGKLEMPLKSETERLQFGDEEVLIGNVKTDIQAKVYESGFICNLGYNEFNVSENDTWNETLNYVYISEVGIYDSNERLVAIGKFGRPFRKENNSKNIIYLTIDF